MFESISPSFHTQITQAPLLVNDFSILTRYKIGKSKPKAFIVHDEPTITKQALAHPEWFQAMKSEHESLMKNNTWVLFTLPPDKRLIGYKWVYEVKKNAYGSVNKYKA